MARLLRRAPKERSRLTELYLSEATGGPYSVESDVQVTRRKAHHMIVRPDGEVVFRSRWWCDIIQWLADEGQERYIIRTPRGSWTAEVVKFNEPEKA